MPRLPGRIGGLGQDVIRVCFRSRLFIAIKKEEWQAMLKVKLSAVIRNVPQLLEAAFVSACRIEHARLYRDEPSTLLIKDRIHLLEYRLFLKHGTVVWDDLALRLAWYEVRTTLK